MIAIGLDLFTGTFREAGRYGFFFFQKKYYPWSIYSCVWCLFDRRHILAPTSSDLVKCVQKGTILAKFHSDINFLTIHGRSRYPSLDIWARNTGQRIGVEILPGHNFLVQAWTYHWWTDIKAGFHEVVVNDQTLEVSNSDANIFLCTHLAFLIRLLNDGRWNSQIDLLSESHHLALVQKKWSGSHHCVKS